MTYPNFAVPNYAFRNRGDLTFEDVSERWHWSAGPDLSHGMAAGDLDGDGDLDVVVNRLGSPALVLRNNAAAPRIAVVLRGGAPNTEAIGATILVRNGAIPLQEREVTAGGLYLSGSTTELTFAAGESDSLVIEVTWRNGTRSRIGKARPNREYEIQEAGSASVRHHPNRPTARPSSPRSLSAIPTTSRSTMTSGAEPLLPNSLAQLGPGVSWVTLDGSGGEVLVVAAGKGGRTAAFAFENEKPRPIDLDFPESTGDKTTILQVPDGQGGSLLLIGQSNYEQSSVDAAAAMPSVLAVPLDRRGLRSGPVRPVIPGDTASIGPLALADYAHDGRLGLFVGGRTYPGAYPALPVEPAVPERRRRPIRVRLGQHGAPPARGHGELGAVDRPGPGWLARSGPGAGVGTAQNLPKREGTAGPVGRARVRPGLQPLARPRQRGFRWRRPPRPGGRPAGAGIPGSRRTAPPAPPLFRQLRDCHEPGPVTHPVRRRA